MFSRSSRCIPGTLRVLEGRKDEGLTTSNRPYRLGASRGGAALVAVLIVALGGSEAFAQDTDTRNAEPSEDSEPAIIDETSPAEDAAPAGSAANSAAGDASESEGTAAGGEVTSASPNPTPQGDQLAAAEPPADESAAESAGDGASSLDASLGEESFSDFSDLEAELNEESMAGPKLDIYGFADFTFQQWLGGGLTAKPTFAVGNFNVYLATDFGSNWRSLAEVRFLYLPHGAAPAGDFAAQRLDATVGDYADFQRPIRWGGIEIERVWLEYEADPLFAVRGGQWLTPYGVWNVDHGSPVIIATNRPYIVGEALIPERQTGLQVHGSGYVGEVKLGYHLTLSNGRGPTDAYADLDANKAVGGRLFMQSSSSLGELTLGASAYAGRYTDSVNTFQVGADGPVFGVDVTDKYDEFAYAADLKWLLGGLHVQSEVVVREVTYDNDLRPADQFGRGGFVPDYRVWGGYVLVGYRTPFFGLMPYVNAEYYNSGPLGIWGRIPAYWFGVNMRPVPSIVLKAQYLYADGTGTPVSGDLEPFSIFTTQAAWSF